MSNYLATSNLFSACYSLAYYLQNTSIFLFCHLELAISLILFFFLPPSTIAYYLQLQDSQLTEQFPGLMVLSQLAIQVATSPKKKKCIKSQVVGSYLAQLAYLAYSALHEPGQLRLRGASIAISESVYAKHIFHYNVQFTIVTRKLKFLSSENQNTKPMPESFQRASFNTLQPLYFCIPYQHNPQSMENSLARSLKFL